MDDNRILKARAEFDDHLSAPPEGYEGKWYTRQELKAVNKQLAKVGRRICRTHQSHALPLDEAHFRRCNNRRNYENQCIECAKRRMREKYHNDPEFHERELQRGRDYYHRANRNHARRCRLLLKVVARIRSPFAAHQRERAS